MSKFLYVLNMVVATLAAYTLAGIHAAVLTWATMAAILLIWEDFRE